MTPPGRSHGPGGGTDQGADRVTVTTAFASTVLPATRPVTVNVPGAAYRPGSTASKVTFTRLSFEPSLNVATTVPGSEGAVPARVVTLSSAIEVTVTASVVRT